MKQFVKFLAGMLLIWVLAYGCEKGDIGKDMNSAATELKKGGNGNGGGGNDLSNNNGIRIMWSDSTVGVPPAGPIYLDEGESVQLYVEYLEFDTAGASAPQWYVIDQQVASVNWQGLLTESWIGDWFEGYPNVTQVTAFVYRPKPNYHGNPWNGWLAPYQDNVIVYINPY